MPGFPGRCITHLVAEAATAVFFAAPGDDIEHRPVCGPAPVWMGESGKQGVSGTYPPLKHQNSLWDGSLHMQTTHFGFWHVGPAIATPLADRLSVVAGGFAFMSRLGFTKRKRLIAFPKH